MSLKERNRIVPQMRDYDRIGDQWVPYLMRFDRPSRNYPAVSTNRLGFRNTTGRDGNMILDYDTFMGMSSDMNRGVVLGASTVFGVGASQDSYSIPSILNRKTDSLWFNFGGRAFNSTQELLLLVLNFPRGISKLVIVSGINNLTLSYLAHQTSPIYNSFFSQSIFERAMEFPPDAHIGVRAGVKLLIKELKNKIYPTVSQGQKKDITLQYDNIIKCYKRDLSIIKNLGDANGFSTYFAFQPVASFIDKKLSTEEEKIFSILDDLGSDWEVLAKYIQNNMKRYVMDLQNICNDINMPFVDANKDKSFCSNEWLFVDRVHLTDNGNIKLSEMLVREFNL